MFNNADYQSLIRLNEDLDLSGKGLIIKIKNSWEKFMTQIKAIIKKATLWVISKFSFIKNFLKHMPEFKEKFESMKNDSTKNTIMFVKSDEINLLNDNILNSVYEKMLLLSSCVRDLKPTIGENATNCANKIDDLNRMIDDIQDEMHIKFDVNASFKENIKNIISENYKLMAENKRNSIGEIDFYEIETVFNTITNMTNNVTDFRIIFSDKVNFTKYISDAEVREKYDIMKRINTYILKIRLFILDIVKEANIQANNLVKILKSGGID